MSLHLRNAEPSDTIYLMGIDVKCYDNAWDSEQWRDVAKNRDQNIICVTHYSKPIAYAAYEIDGTHLKVLRLGVLPRHRRQGVGRSILNWFDRLMHDKRLKRATCIVQIDNLIACNFLKSAGWRVPAKGGIVKDAFDDCGTLIEGLFFIRE